MRNELESGKTLSGMSGKRLGSGPLTRREKPIPAIGPGELQHKSGTACASKPPSVQQARIPKFETDVPRCFTYQQYALWKAVAREVTPGIVGPCADCTPTYQRRMKKQGRCEREIIRFRWDEDGLCEGFMPPLTSKEKLIRKLEIEIEKEKAAAKI